MVMRLRRKMGLNTLLMNVWAAQEMTEERRARSHLLLFNIWWKFNIKLDSSCL